jgi:hypothetical protein
VIADLDAGEPLAPGQRLPIEFDMTRAGFFDVRTGLALA